MAVVSAANQLVGFDEVAVSTRYGSDELGVSFQFMVAVALPTLVALKFVIVVGAATKVTVVVSEYAPTPALVRAATLNV